MHVCVCRLPTASGLAVMDEVDLTPSVVWTELGSTVRKIVGSEEWSIFCQETLVLMGILMGADSGTLTKQNIEWATKVTLTAYKVGNCYCENSNSSGQIKKKRELVLKMPWFSLSFS